MPSLSDLVVQRSFKNPCPLFCLYVVIQPFSAHIMSMNPGRARNNLNGAVVRIAGDNNGVTNSSIRLVPSGHDRSITAQVDPCANIVRCTRVMAHLCAERVICREKVALELSSDACRVCYVNIYCCLRDKPVIVDNRTGRGVGARTGIGV